MVKLNIEMLFWIILDKFMEPNYGQKSDYLTSWRAPSYYFCLDA